MKRLLFVFVCTFLSVLTLKPAQAGYRSYEQCQETEVTPTPTPEITPEATPSATPTPEVTPEISHPQPQLSAPSPNNPGAPVCPDGNTIKLPANFHIIRTLDRAELRWIPTQGNLISIFYKRADQSNWEHAVGDLPNNGNFVINGLDSQLGYTFGIMQHEGCGGGEIATAVVIDPPANGVMFRFSYWIWNK